MNKIIAVFALVALMVGTTACKKNKDNEAARHNLVSLVKQINEQSEKELKNGTILKGCEYQVGDSLFTYIITVKDNRMDNVEEDTIRNSFSKTVKSPAMSKVVNALVKAEVGLDYRVETDTHTFNIIFTASDLKAISEESSIN